MWAALGDVQSGRQPPHALWGPSVFDCAEGIIARGGNKRILSSTSPRVAARGRASLLLMISERIGEPSSPTYSKRTIFGSQATQSLLGVLVLFDQRLVLLSRQGRLVLRFVIGP